MARTTKVQYVNFYTAGSVAYKYQPEQPIKKKVQLPKPKTQQKIVIQVDPVAVLGICVAVVMLIVMLSGLVNLASVRQENQAMREYVEALQQENTALQETYRQGYDLEEIRQIAIARGMIPKEEAQRQQIHVQIPEAVEEPSVWENFRTFLAGLFA